MKILIQKFGGTSVATEEARHRVVEIISKASSEYDGVIVVVSAMGRIGAPYATDTLLSLINHDIQSIEPRELDLLLHTGELISAVVLSYLLNSNNVKALAMSGNDAGIICSNCHSNAAVIKIEKEALQKAIREGYIPIVAGFQGRTVDHKVTTLGRGGSDTTAALLGETFEAESVEIYTDVDGIMTADPKYCNNAKTLEKISYNEVFQLADSGAKVIHKDAVEVARRAHVPLKIKNTFSNNPGTAIYDYHSVQENIAYHQIITGIAHRLNRIQFSVKGNLDDDAFFKALADVKVSIDIINIFPKFRVFTTEDTSEQAAVKVLEQFNASYDLIRNCAKVTAVGEKMTGVPGVMAMIIHALKEVNVEILQTADSLSTIACLIHDKDLEKAIDALHRKFDL